MLSNCDAKFMTKALSNKMIKMKDDVIDENQTAYLKGWSVMDNQRGSTYIKKCTNEDIFREKSLDTTGWSGKPKAFLITRINRVHPQCNMLNITLL